MHRKRKHDIAQTVKKYPIKVYLFDILFMNDRDFTAYDYIKRREILEKFLETNNTKIIELVKQIIVNKTSQIKRFFSLATKNGCEGLMFKQLNSRYRAGSREYLWMKLKKEYDETLGDSFDLTVIGAMLGKGRRTGYYGALLLAIYDGKTNTFHSTCKVGTGFSDKNLEFLYFELKKYITAEKDSRVVCKMKMDIWFKPLIVLEIIASEITLSPIHTAASNLIKKNFGLALRFPKFSGKIRYDKNAEDSTTAEELLDFYKIQLKKRGSR
jgi:DNA ligase-1